MTGTPTRVPGLELSVPLLAAPMAGGPTTPALVVAAARAGGLGFLAGGYRTVEDLAEQIGSVAAETATFGVNLFAPNPVPVNRAAYERYRASLRGDAARFGAVLPAEPTEDDDGWRDKVDLLTSSPVPVVSFTFGIPDAASVTVLRRAGSVLVQTVTSPEEAVRAVDAGVDVVAVQSAAAGGHSATLNPHAPRAPISLGDLVTAVRRTIDLPVIAAGGVASCDDVVGAIHRGATNIMVGTALLLSPESGASAPYRRALRERGRGDTVVTKAFTGRPARGLRNVFVDRYEDIAPTGYPAVHHLTRALRRAATTAGDPEFMNLWAGVGYQSATDRPAEETLRDLASKL